MHVARERETTSKADQKKCDDALVAIIHSVRKHTILNVVDEELEETAAAAASGDEDDMFA